MPGRIHRCEGYDSGRTGGPHRLQAGDHSLLRTDRADAQPECTASGYRQYDPRQEERPRFSIRHRELGFSSDDLKSANDLKGLLELVDRRAVTCAEVNSTAQTHLAAGREKIADLRRMERVLNQTVKSYSGEYVPEHPPRIDTLHGEAGRPVRGDDKQTDSWSGSCAAAGCRLCIRCNKAHR